MERKNCKAAEDVRGLSSCLPVNLSICLFLVPPPPPPPLLLLFCSPVLLVSGQASPRDMAGGDPCRSQCLPDGLFFLFLVCC